MKIGRNDPCPCGSGKKYKKCCSPKYDKPVAVGSAPKPTVKEMKRIMEMDFQLDDKKLFASLNDLWTPEKVAEMSDEDIVAKLLGLGIPITRDQFRADLENQLEIQPVLSLWKDRYGYDIEGKDADFPYCALMTLWKRWSPEQIGVLQIEEMLDDMIEAPESVSKLLAFEYIWSILKQRIIIPLDIRSFDDLQNRFDWEYDLESIFFDFEGDFIYECRKDKAGEKFAVLIAIYEDILHTLPENDPHNLLNIRRSLAEAFMYSGETEQGEACFQQLTGQHPSWVWGYVGWGDLYADSRSELYNREKAAEIYRIGLQNSTEERDLLEERLKNLETAAQ